MSQTSPRKERRVATKRAVAHGEVAPVKRNLNVQELLELQEIHRLAAAKALEANQVRLNTARIPRSGFLGMRDGKALAAELEATARILEEAKNQWLRSRLVACGYLAGTVCDINMATGQITPTSTTS